MNLEQYNKQELINLEAMYANQGKRKQCDEIRWEITHRMAEEREQRGDISWLMYAGYTGRNSNRR